MPTNFDTHSPTVQPNLAYDSDLDPTLRGVIVKAPGTLFFEDIEGNEESLTFADIETDGTSSTSYPYILPMQIRKIIGDGSGNAGDGSTGTDIALASLIGLH